ncbi:MAG: helix-turn-helix transcriptional regulator [Clostridia bacterium]|jgi:transcriptional regulator with XRE-family HTH domain|nr:helix-turn-helix transcriptional regulator [Clostridia bacterium]NDO18463.1 helix-turn-helix transcriptional regulator [Lachnospiraceae bacterium MD329]
MDDNVVLVRLKELQDNLGWTDYQLSKRADIPQGTISNIYKRNTIPTISTLSSICKAFGITMAQFFAGNNEVIDLTPKMSELFHNWIQLSEKNQNIILDLVKELNSIDSK